MMMMNIGSGIDDHSIQLKLQTIGGVVVGGGGVNNKTKFLRRRVLQDRNKRATPPSRPSGWSLGPPAR